MAEVGEFKLYDADMEDKLKYKETFRTLRIDRMKSRKNYNSDKMASG